jgi:predicted GNAT family acetyltransferase
VNASGPSPRVLDAGDQERLVAFLCERLDTSLFLLSNLERAGIVDRGQPFQGTYVGAFAQGELLSVAVHCWNGVVLVQGDAEVEAAAQRAIAETGRQLAGLIGPWALLTRLFVSLNVPRTVSDRHLPEVLFSLRLEALRVPASLRQEGIVVRVPTEEEVEESLVSVRLAYEAEALGLQETAESRQAARADLHASRLREDCFIVLDHGQLVAFTAFNARAQGVVQVGGVFTPPSERSKGYARAAVAASLLRARAQGMTRSVLFTGRDNLAAQRCYRALGFSEVGEYGVVLL